MRPLWRSGPSPVTAAAVDGAFLQPGMDARALNLDQYDPSAAVDSQLERIRALALRLPPSRECEALMAEVDRAIASNLAEGDAELGICGVADQLVTDLRRTERNGVEQVLGAKAIARHLREPLACIVHPTGRSAAELTNARQLLSATIAEVPQLMLLSQAVARELGAEKFAALIRLAEKDGASRLETAGAVDERGHAHHGQL